MKKTPASLRSDPRPQSAKLTAAMERNHWPSCAKYAHGLISDYDGTICDHVDRFGAIPQSTVEALNRLTNAGFLLGVATGRGKSVRETLRNAITKRDWERVWVGYYNGGLVARLDDPSQPNTDRPIPEELQSAARALKKIGDHELELTIRPDQITIEARIPLNVRELWFRVIQAVKEAKITGLKVVASTRSVDVIPVATTKLSLFRALDQARPNSAFLCMGDRPCWPGNDAELLTQDFSLSVDEVSGNPASVWNLVGTSKNSPLNLLLPFAQYFCSQSRHLHVVRRQSVDSDARFASFPVVLPHLHSLD